MRMFALFLTLFFFVDPAFGESKDLAAQTVAAAAQNVVEKVQELADAEKEKEEADKSMDPGRIAEAAGKVAGAVQNLEVARTLRGASDVNMGITTLGGAVAK